MIEDEISDAVLDLTLYVDLLPEASPELRRLTDRLRDLRARLDNGESMMDWGTADDHEGDEPCPPHRSRRG